MRTHEHLHKSTIAVTIPLVSGRCLFMSYLNVYYTFISSSKERKPVLLRRPGTVAKVRSPPPITRRQFMRSKMSIMYVISHLTLRHEPNETTSSPVVKGERAGGHAGVVRPSGGRAGVMRRAGGKTNRQNELTVMSLPQSGRSDDWTFIPI